MAFKVDDFSKLKRYGEKTIYVYNTIDDIATVMTVGYFNNTAPFSLIVGDMVICNIDTDGVNQVHHLLVSDKTSGVVTVSYSDAGAALDSLGVTTFVQTLLDDADASSFLSTLGVSDFVQTLLDDLTAAAFLVTLGALQAYSSTMSGNETYVCQGGIRAVCFLDPDGTDREFTPTTGFFVGYEITIVNLGVNLIVFNPSGFTDTIGSGEKKSFFYDGTNWY